MSVWRKKCNAALALAGLLCLSGASVSGQSDGATLFHAARVFDGHEIRTGVSVLIDEGKVVRIDQRSAFAGTGTNAARVIDLGDATLLPGFIELHAHLTFQNVPQDVVLRHGVTTVRDLGGPVHHPRGGDGALRVLTSGPAITAPGGYPITVFGERSVATSVTTAADARKRVRELVDGGAVVIKIALEPGGQSGAPWSGGLHAHGGEHTRGAGHAAQNHGHGGKHGHAHGQGDEAQHQPASMPADHAHAHGQSHERQATGAVQGWPLLAPDIVKAIVDEAHRHGRKVSAHIGEERGARIALDAGVDEWAHIPCAALPDGLLLRAARHKVVIVTTMDTLSRCDGVAANARGLGVLGANLLYGAEIAHPDVPWGIDAQELMYMQQWAGMKTVDVLRAATSRAGAHLGIPLLGTLQPGAPADIIAVRGNPLHALKTLEYPDLVVSGGKLIVNRFD